MPPITATEIQNKLTLQARQLLQIAEDHLIEHPEISLEQVHYVTRLGSTDPQINALALRIKGEAELNQDHNLEGMQSLNQALQHAISVNVPSLELEIHMLLGKAFRKLGNFGQALNEFLESTRLAEKLSKPETLAAALNGVAGVYYVRGEYQKSLTYLEKAVKIQSEFPDLGRAAKTLTNIGLQYIELAEFPKALKNLFKALKLIQHDQKDIRDEGACLLNIGIVYQELADYQRALEFYTKSLEVANQIGYTYMQCNALVNAGSVHIKLGNHQAAFDMLNQALEKARSHNLLQLETRALDSMGQAFQDLGNLPFAIEHHLKAIKIAKTIGDIECEIDARLNIGHEYLLANDPAQAHDHLEQALRLAVKVNRKTSIAKAHELLAQTFETIHQPEKAIHHLKQQLLCEREIAKERNNYQVQSLGAQLELERSRHENELYRIGNLEAKKAKEKAEGEVRDRTEQLEQAQLEIIERLAIAAEYRDDVTGEHAVRVGQYSALIAEKLGLESSSVELLRQAGRLHDVGKIGIPDSILLKPGIFTP